MHIHIPKINQNKHKTFYYDHNVIKLINKKFECHSLFINKFYNLHCILNDAEDHVTLNMSYPFQEKIIQPQIDTLV